MNVLLPPGWANTPLTPRGRRSSDDKRQRGTNDPSCGSFRATQVTQTGKKEKKREGKRRQKQIKTHTYERESERSPECLTVIFSSRIVSWGQRAVSCFSVPSTASLVRLSSGSTPGCGTAVS